jgi:hypothetical protein
LFLIPQVPFDLFLVFEVERDGPVNPYEGTGHRKGAENPFRRLVVLECMNDAVERKLAYQQCRPAVTLLDVVLHVSDPYCSLPGLKARGQRSLVPASVNTVPRKPEMLAVLLGVAMGSTAASLLDNRFLIVQSFDAMPFSPVAILPRASRFTTIERSPEKAAVGGSIPSLVTMFSITYKPSNLQFRSSSFQFQACRTSLMD